MLNLLEINTVDWQCIAPTVTSWERPISGLHGGGKVLSSNPVYCISVWFCIDLDIIAYQTAYALKACTVVCAICAMHPHSNDQHVCTLLRQCVCFAWRKYADKLPACGAMNCESCVLDVRVNRKKIHKWNTLSEYCFQNLSQCTIVHLGNDEKNFRQILYDRSKIRSSASSRSLQTL